MARHNFKSIDDYESFLGTTIEGWTPKRRAAFAAAIAGRWLPCYETFSAEEDWGDPDALQRTMDAIWDHVAGQPMAAAEQTRRRRQLEEITPHMDDFDAWDAMAACVILGNALDCCGSANNKSHAILAALGGFEAAVPDWAFDPEEQPKLWKKVAARKELKKQLRVLERVGDVESFDEPTIAKLRKDLTSAELIGETTVEKPAPQPRQTNQAAFELYRRLVEQDLRGKPDWETPAGGEFMVGIMVSAEWGLRYDRRLKAITYEYFSDTIAREALVARNRARDALVTDMPDGNAEILQALELSLSNWPGFDARSLKEPHGYGPSVRWLWSEGKQQGLSEEEIWRSIIDWARHRPEVWQTEDRRKKKGQAYTNSQLGGHLQRELAWTATEDPDHPWQAKADSSTWRVRLNNFPDEIMYTLIIDDQVVGDFHDWPGRWQR